MYIPNKSTNGNSYKNVNARKMDKKFIITMRNFRMGN